MVDFAFDSSAPQYLVGVDEQNDITVFLIKHKEQSCSIISKAAFSTSGRVRSLSVTGALLTAQITAGDKSWLQLINVNFDEIENFPSQAEVQASYDLHC